MSEILDSGDRKKFESGAVRDIQDGKGRCDLLPLDVISELYSFNTKLVVANILENIECFKISGDIGYLFKVLSDFLNGIGFENIPTAILEVSKHFEDGAKKYGKIKI